MVNYFGRFWHAQHSTLFGASLSEPHINGTAVRELYIYIYYYYYGTSVT